MPGKTHIITSDTQEASKKDKPKIDGSSVIYTDNPDVQRIKKFEAELEQLRAQSPQIASLQTSEELTK